MVHRCTGAISQKPAKINPEKGSGLGHVTLINFCVPPNISTKRVELETSNLVHRCRVAISQKPAKKKLEKGRGIGHVTLIRRISKTCKHICKPLLKIFYNSIEAKLLWKLLIKQQILNVKNLSVYNTV